jgi:hypothetical protein
LRTGRRSLQQPGAGRRSGYFGSGHGASAKAIGRDCSERTFAVSRRIGRITGD